MTRVSYVTVKGIKPHRGVKVSVAEFRAMWMDPALTMDDIAARLNISKKAVEQRAYHRNMPDRRPVIWQRLCGFDAAFRAMWEGCVASEDIAAHYGRTVSAVEKHARRNGWKRARRCTRWNPPLTLDQWRQSHLARRMAVEAEATRAAMQLSEMVDKAASNWRAA